MSESGRLPSPRIRPHPPIQPIQPDTEPTNRYITRAKLDELKIYAKDLRDQSRTEAELHKVATSTARNRKLTLQERAAAAQTAKTLLKSQEDTREKLLSTIKEIQRFDPKWRL